MKRVRQRRARQPAQLELPLRTWGGRRRGAGRKPKGVKEGVCPPRRPSLSSRHPVHATMKLAAALPSLRQKPLSEVVFGAFREAKERLGARLVQFSVQSNHLHLLVEAADARALGRAMKGLAIRLALRLNRRLGRRGKAFADRYHARALRTPLEVRRALVYVLHNHRRHFTPPGALSHFDEFSSAACFDGFTLRAPPRPSGRFVPPPEPPVAPARTWLLRIGWRRYGLLGAAQ